MSADIVSLDAHRDAQIDRAWERFRELDRIACATGKLADAIAAARARHEFYDLFDRPEQRALNVAFRHFGGGGA